MSNFFLDRYQIVQVIMTSSHPCWYYPFSITAGAQSRAKPRQTTTKLRPFQHTRPGRMCDPLIKLKSKTKLHTHPYILTDKRPQPLLSPPSIRLA